MGRDTFSFDVNCYNVMVNANNGKSVTATLDSVEKSDILDLFDSQEFIDHVGVSSILDQIGEDEVRKHFNIE